MKKLEREALLADREAVKAIIAELRADDPLGRFSFDSRLSEIEDQLSALEARHETHGSVALLFHGGPVQGSRSIDAEFASRALSSFQDIITKHLATEERGQLGSRGRIPLRTASSLAISDLVRGSVGFVLEESGDNAQLVDSSVKQAIDEVTNVIAKTASENDSDFEEAVEEIDHRELISLRHFFATLDDNRATLRIVEDDRDAVLDNPAVKRARQRVDMIEIDENENDHVVGRLIGLMPSSKRFEMQLTDSGEIIRGRISPAVANKHLELIESPDHGLVGHKWRTKMKIREVRERNKPPRYVYLLVGLLRKLKD